jgi:hypothetical protein
LDGRWQGDVNDGSTCIARCGPDAAALLLDAGAAYRQADVSLRAIRSVRENGFEQVIDA